MSSNPFPPEDAIKLLGRRNLASIPKDQQALLEGPNSWAVDLKDKPLGMVNIPGHVLETLKEAHIALISAAQQHPASSSAPPQPESQPQTHSSPTSSRNGGGDPSGSTSSSNPPNIQDAQNGDADSPPASSPERRLSWSSSPDRPQPPRQVAMGSPIVRETPKTAPMGPPPRPLPVFGPPSSGAEEDLEMELPQPQVRRDPPLNRAAAPLTETVESPIASEARVIGTPPCAQPTHPTQPVILNTVVAEKVTAPLAQCPPEQRRRMKMIQFENKTPKKNQASNSRLAPTKTFTQVESSNSTSPSSVIPATFDEPTTPGPVLQSVENVEVIDVDELDNRKSEDGIEPVIVESQVQAPVTSSDQSRGAIPDSQPPSLQISLGGDIQPYTAFKTAYPAYEEIYNGDLWQFIKSCVILEFLRRQRLLRDCLYDDFIRAFPGYQTYVNNAGPEQEALPAIEWFSNLPGPPTFNCMAVTKDNIGYILDFYPKEVAGARRMINNNADEDIVEKRPMPISIDDAIDIGSRGPRPAQSKSMPVPTPSNVSQPREVLTQAPPPPSPIWDSSAPPSTINTPTSGTKPPRPSQYFQRLAASAKSSSTPLRRSAEDRAKLREHFLKRKSSGAGSARSSKVRRL